MATYLLVHGAWHSGRIWDRVVPLLTAAGHRVLAPSLTGHGERSGSLGPGVGLDTYADDVVRVLTGEELTGVVLVGHSYAGMIISAVAERVPERLAHLVYLDAMVPEDGENAIDVIPMTRFLIDQAARTDEPWRIPPIPEMPPPAGLFGVTDPADVAWVRSLLSDEPVRCFEQRVRLGNPAAAAVGRTHLHCVGGVDRERRPAPAGAQVWELPTGHDCMVTMPVELAGLLQKLA
ncbi:esterase [Actinoplanes sp. NBRC 14428]|uniref:Alpha/beta hydrolase family protein n=1 Tax=Pseudosporangium ferrugineum TaxID=439699 RepID=A0A2T0RJH8_9ACTN|nr:alpha/beta fold hydrolase [Pseudosporangium ferrugineum]PRY21346.1 alpha/beta hydrolase family protein [Pseudosporangium ferrugineum]BCJ56043.1 esterase [Actinoplanes sp. NBRC 14428]